MQDCWGEKDSEKDMRKKEGQFDVEHQGWRFHMVILWRYRHRAKSTIFKKKDKILLSYIKRVFMLLIE